MSANMLTCRSIILRLSEALQRIDPFLVALWGKRIETAIRHEIEKYRKSVYSAKPAEQVPLRTPTFRK
jgi:hypothetical protein